MIFVRCGKGFIDSILIVAFLKKDVLFGGSSKEGIVVGTPEDFFALTHFAPPASVSAKILVGAQKSIFPGSTSSAERAF
jgi:hypothetical protein